MTNCDIVFVCVGLISSTLTLVMISVWGNILYCGRESSYALQVKKKAC